MSVFKVKTTFTFIGEFEVHASDKEEARELVEKHCGLVIGGDIHSSLPSDEVSWEFPVHPTKKISIVRTYIKSDS